MPKIDKKSKESRAGLTLMDQFSFTQVGVGKGRNKPARLTHFDLRNLANNNALVRICINRLKHQVTKAPYVIRAIDPKENDALQNQIKYVEMLLKEPNANPNENNYRSLISEVAEDILVLDQAYIEKVRNPKGYVMELYHVDGATIKPNIDEYGLYSDPAYYQYVSPGSDKPDAEFQVDDLMMFMVNPQGQSGKIGYGMSPVESVVATVVASIQAALYNNSYFDDSKLPPAIVSLPDVPTQDLVNFKNAFEAQLAGKPWSNAYINSSNVEVKPLRPTNQDMQFYELNTWLAKIIFASFELSPQDLGFTMDINKATAQVQERLSKSGGIGNLLDVIAEEINSDLIGDLAKIDERFSKIQFVFDDIDKIDETSQAQIDQIYIQNGVITPNEIRIRKGLDPIVETSDTPKQSPEIKQTDGVSTDSTDTIDTTQKSFKAIEKWLNMTK